MQSESMESPGVSSADTAKSPPLASPMSPSEKDLDLQCCSCLENLRRCVDAVEIVAKIDYTFTRTTLKLAQSRVHEHRLHLTIWIADFTVGNRTLSAITAEREPTLFAALAAIFNRINEQSRTILSSVQEMGTKAAQSIKGVDEKASIASISQSKQRIEDACDNLTFSIYDLAKLKSSVQMATAIYIGQGCEAALYEAIQKVQDDSGQGKSPSYDDTRSGSGVIDDSSSHVSGDERCSQCQAWLPWYALAHHRMTCSAEPKPPFRYTILDFARYIVQSLVAVIMEASNMAGAVHKVAMGTAVATSACDIASTALKAARGIASTATKIMGDSVGTFAKVGSDVARTIVKIADDTLTTAVHAASRALSSRAADAFLKYATHVFATAGDAMVVDAILEVIIRSLQAMTQSLSRAMLIWSCIFTNGTNEDTLRFILNHLDDFLRFLYDLGKPGNVVSGFSATDDGIEGTGDGFPGADNPHNELDLRRAENRHAVIYQVQRVALTLIAILNMGREVVPPSGLGGFQMNVSLRSDFKDGNPPSPTYVSTLGDSPPNEKWLFINGIANEFVWFQRSCDKIRDTFKREVRGIYNRSDGILWDFIECCGEHRAVRFKGLNALIERTPSSKAAQATLERELKDALWPVDRSAPDKVVMIAHSQGCLLLRLALQTLVSENPRGSQHRRDMKERLRVFTFGNPSIDWRVIDGTEQSLSEYANATEHFAHEADFVAMLGVVTHRDDSDSGYGKGSVFYSKEGKAHLFGAHYPLGSGAYDNGAESKLLKAVNGNEIT